MLVHLSKRQIGVFVDAQLGRWHEEAIGLLRDCFPQRLAAQDDAALVALCTASRAEGRRWGFDSEADLTRHAIASVLLGRGFVDDWQHSWLFNEDFGSGLPEWQDCYNLSTLLDNLDRAVTAGLVSEASPSDWRKRCHAAEERLVASPGDVVVQYDDALRFLNQAKFDWLGPPRLARFVEACGRTAAERGEDRVERWVLLAWLHGHRFYEDPLCLQASAFLKEAVAVQGISARQSDPQA